MAAALGVEVGDLAVQGNALDPSPDVVGRLMAGSRHARHDVPFEAAVVADVHGPVGTDRGAVGAAAALADDLDPALRIDTGEGSPLDLDEDHRTVAHRDQIGRASC